MVQDKKYIIGNKDIDASFITLAMWILPSDPRIKKQIGQAKPDDLIEIISGKTIIYHIDARTAGSFFDHCAKVLLTNHQLLISLVRKTERITKQIRILGKKYFLKTEKLNNAQIIALLKKIDYLQTEAVVSGVALAFADIQGAVTNELIKITNYHVPLPEPVYLYTSILGTPPQKSLTEKAYEEIRQSKKSVAAIARQFFWLDQGYIGRGFTSEMTKLIKQKKAAGSNLSRRALLKDLKFSQKEAGAFVTAQKIIYAKMLRTDSRQFVHVIINQIIDRYAKKWDIDAKYLEALTTKELCLAIKNNGTLPENLKERFKHSLSYCQNGKYQFLLGNQVNNWLKKHSALVQSNNQISVSGQVAQIGIVTGTARLIFGPQHNNKIKKGDILISMATSPQLLPAMKRAAAFVTDVGGITSHAAIVARELKKPCIVGTKYATQIFKDGDQVEVDANKGIVKKI